MNPRTKIKVSREALLERVKARRAEAVAKHAAAEAKYQAALGKYETALATWREKVRTLVRKTIESDDFAVEAEAVYRRGSYKAGLVLDGAPKAPTHPPKPGDLSDITRRLDSAIAQLEMSVEDTISLSVEDYGLYIGD